MSTPFTGSPSNQNFPADQLRRNTDEIRDKQTVSFCDILTFSNSKIYSSRSSKNEAVKKFFQECLREQGLHENVNAECANSQIQSDIGGLINKMVLANFTTLEFKYINTYIRMLQQPVVLQNTNTDTSVQPDKKQIAQEFIEKNRKIQPEYLKHIINIANEMLALITEIRIVSTTTAAPKPVAVHRCMPVAPVVCKASPTNTVRGFKVTR